MKARKGYTLWAEPFRGDAKCDRCTRRSSVQLIEAKSSDHVRSVIVGFRCAKHKPKNL